MSTVTMDRIVSLAKQRGFVFPSSEIYGGYTSFYDYGPLGVELKNNLKKLWWKSIVAKHEDIVGLDGAIFTNPKVWEASGHVAAFVDPLVDCKSCKKRFRADHLVENATEKSVDGISLEGINKMIKEHNIPCPSCGAHDFTEARTFNLLVKASLGVTEDEKSVAYLRGETCQTIYLNFKNIMQSMRKKVPFGIAQIGKAFRNEITPGNFIFRMREFEQMEMQYFIKPGANKEVFEQWKAERLEWHINTLGINKDNLRFRQHDTDERAHYASDAWDIEYRFPFGFKEVEGIHDRGDWDLSQHSKGSGEDLRYFDQTTNEHYIPHIIETSVGADRLALVTLIDAYHEEEVDGETRVVMRFNKAIAPYKIAVLPLTKKLDEQAYTVFNQLSDYFMCDYDTTQSIGKRYRRQDEIGTPYCVTIDFDTLEDNAVTVRDRDTMEQERIKIEDLVPYFMEKLR